MTIYDEIQAERAAQDTKWGEQNHPFVYLSQDQDNPVEAYTHMANLHRDACDKAFANGRGRWSHILNEEIFEAYEQAAMGNTQAFREELVQVAAVVVAMIECLDRNGIV